MAILLLSVTNLPAMQETQVWTLGQENPMEKEMPSHCGILSWENPGTVDTGGLECMGLQESNTT